ncbi:MAG TPA: cation:proton antiporter [Acidimicrobiales bacterium]|jgi:Kef-type K+ transport system membrane component KefB|nr:cation:proton antiporter [Acidimicrobiales bacterium]
MIEGAIPTLVLIGLAAVLAPIVSEWSRRVVAIPEVVIQIVFGIILGPYILNLAHPNSLVTSLADFGLTYLMFLAGTELDLSTMRQGHLGRAAGSWLTSLVLALAVGYFLHATGLVLDHTVVALCLTTTALGTLIPILHDAGVLHTRLGPSVLSVGALGEFGPIVAVAVFLTNRDARLTFLLLGLFVAIAVVAALLATDVHPPRFVALMRRHLHSTSQLPVRISVLLVILLVYLAEELSLDVLLGAFAAGVVVRLFIKGEDSVPITSKLEAIGFGFLIPIFFIDSGIKFDLHALIHMPKVLLLVPMFTIIFLFTRALPTWAFFRNVVTKVEARSLAVLSATGLPIIVVITTLGVQEHRMKPQNAAALVAAGMLSVLIYPLVGLRWLGKGTSETGTPDVAERSDGR